MVGIKKISGQLTRHPRPVQTALGGCNRHVCSVILRRKLKTGSGGCLKSNVIDGSEYRQRTTVHNYTTVETNGLHGANVQLSSAPFINKNLHKHPIELSHPLFPFYHCACSCNKLHRSKTNFLGHFYLKKKKPSCLSTFSRKYETSFKSTGGLETGWKSVHGDVVRVPTNASLLCVYGGTRVQFFVMTLVTVIFAILGFLSLLNRGSLMTAMLLLWVFMGLVAGYASSCPYNMFKGTKQRRNMLKQHSCFQALPFAFSLFSVHSYGKKSVGVVSSRLCLPQSFYGLEFLCHWSLWEVTLATRNLQLKIQ